LINCILLLLNTEGTEEEHINLKRRSWYVTPQSVLGTDYFCCCSKMHVRNSSAKIVAKLRATKFAVTMFIFYYQGIATHQQVPIIVRTCDHEHFDCPRCPR